MALRQAFCGWGFAREPRLVPSGPDIAAILGPGTPSRKRVFRAQRRPPPYSGIGLLVARPDRTWMSIAGSSVIGLAR